MLSGILILASHHLRRWLTGGGFPEMQGPRGWPRCAQRPRRSDWHPLCTAGPKSCLLAPPGLWDPEQATGIYLEVPECLCSGLNSVSQYHVHPRPVNGTLFGKRVFVDELRVR